jgi:hypothetical protein
MIATRDIGAVAAEELLKLHFQQKQTRELQGQRDLTMMEAAAIIGNKTPTSYEVFVAEEFVPVYQGKACAA